MTAFVPALLVLFTAIGAATEEPPRPAAQGSDDVEVVVNALRDPTPLARTPAAISVVDVPRELVAGPAVTLDEPLAFVPGVVAHGSNNFAQDLQLSIRGFGARAAFGIRGVTLLVDGFPETLPDGQAQVDTIDPARSSASRGCSTRARRGGSRLEAPRGRRSWRRKT